ncbi:hypothetical protein [Enterococcus sp. LJL51]|uniref:hypothetical protein n=1 Tax=Enterococcus sp. LJL51 TaxID=3416656 RepID=UPI003CEB7A68
MKERNTVTTVLQTRDKNFSATFQRAVTLLGRYRDGASAAQRATVMLDQTMRSTAATIDMVGSASRSAAVQLGVFAEQMNQMDNAALFNQTLNQSVVFLEAMNQKLGESSNQMDIVSQSTALATAGLQEFIAQSYLMGEIGTVFSTVSTQIAHLTTTGINGLLNFQSVLASGFPTIELFSNIWVNVDGDFQRILSGLQLTGERFILSLSQMFQQAASQFDLMIGGMEQSAESSSSFWDILKGIDDFLGSSFSEAILDVAGNFLELNGDVMGSEGVISQYAEVIRSSFSSILDLNSSLGSSLSSAITSFTQPITEAGGVLSFFKEQVSAGFSAVKNSISNTVASARGALMNLGLSINQAGGIVPFFSQQVVAGFSTVKNNIGNMVVSARGALMNLGVSIGQAGGILPYFSQLVVSATSTAGSAFTSLGALIISNPLIVGIALIIAAVAGFAAAWQSNFMNIKGFVSSAFGAIKNSLTSMGDMFKGIMPFLSSVGDAFKTLGVILAGGVLIAIAAVVDMFRGIVFGGISVINTAQAVGSAITGIWAKINGDDKAADEAFSDMKMNLTEIKEGFDNLKDNSAIAGVIGSTSELTNNTKELKEETVATAEQIAALGEAYRETFDEAGNRIDNLALKYSEVGQAAITAFSGEGLEQSTKRFEAAEEIMGRHGEKLKEIKTQVGEKLTQAEQLTGEEQAAAQSEAYSMMIEQASFGSSEMLTVMQANKEMLVAEKTLEGQALSDEQRRALQDQNNAIREGLMEQQQLIVEASAAKLENGKQLSDAELKATMSANQALYQNRKEQLEANETEIASLKAEYAATEDEVQKANFQQQIDALGMHNEQLRLQQEQAGLDTLSLLQQNEQMKAETIAQGLNGVGVTTDEALTGLVQKYADSGVGIDQQMQLLAGILHQRGLDAGDSLLTALQTNDFGAVAAGLSDSAVNGLAGLPEGMFVNGAAGKDAFIQALESGSIDASQIGSHLIGAMNTSVANEKSNVEVTAKNVATGGSDAIKQQNSQFNTAGKQNIDAYNNGISAYGVNVSNTALAVAQRAKASAETVDFSSVGIQMANGIASGINAGASGAIGAMVNLVNQINAEARKVAQIKSPSRLFRDTVGRFIAQGVAVGIEEDTEVAVASAKNMIAEVQNAVSGSTASAPKAELKVEHDVQNSMVGQLQEMVSTIKNMNVVLESGALVGGIGGSMDGFLGNRTGYVGRYR